MPDLPDLRIAELAEDDVDAVWAFFQRVPESDRTFVKQPVTDVETVRRWLLDERASRWLAWSGDEVVGYVAVLTGVGWSSHVGELRLVVDPAVRRRGLGQRLARHALRVALDQRLTKVTVEVVAAQESTIALFTGLGFRAEALLVDHVQGPDRMFADLIVLANRTDTDWDLMNVVGLDEPLD